MSDPLIADFGRTFELGAREAFIPGEQKSIFLAGSDGALVQKTLSTGEAGQRTRAVVIGEAGIFGILPEPGIDSDGIATFAEILPQTVTSKCGTVALPFGEVNAISFKGSGSALTGVIHAADLAAYQPTSQKGNANGYASLDSGGKVPVAQLPQPPALTIASVSTTYAQLATDRLILADPTSGNFTVSLLAVAAFVGIPLTLKHVGTAGAFTIDPNGSETIDGNLTVSLNIPGASLTIISDGTKWRII